MDVVHDPLVTSCEHGFEGSLSEEFGCDHGLSPCQPFVASALEDGHFLRAAVDGRTRIRPPVPWQSGRSGPQRLVSPGRMGARVLDSLVRFLTHRCPQSLNSGRDSGSLVVTSRCQSTPQTTSRTCYNAATKLRYPLRIAITLRSPFNPPKPTRSGRTGSAADHPEEGARLCHPSISIGPTSTSSPAFRTLYAPGSSPPESVNLAGTARMARPPVGWPSDAD